MRLNLIILNSHPIQYFAPLYKQIAQDETFDLTVLYCSTHGLEGDWDRQFQTHVRWDVPLLEGYRYKFLQNAAPTPSIYHFWGLLNISIIAQLWQRPKSVLIVHGWAYAVNWLAILFGKILGHTVCLRGENQFRQEAAKRGWLSPLRRVLLRYGLFSCVDYFLYIGRQNKAFYQAYGQPDRKLVFTPYSVNNSCFAKQYKVLKHHSEKFRRQVGLPVNQAIILYSGKYIAKKRPMDLLQAFHQLGRADVALVMMGEGELRTAMKSYIRQHAVQNVFLTGFVNQSKLADYYASADIYVMCSDVNETWGLATNEAMNFGLPIVLAHEVGCADDLLLEGKNGYGYQTGDIQGLMDALQRILNQDEWTRKAMAANRASASANTATKSQLPP